MGSKSTKFQNLYTKLVRKQKKKLSSGILLKNFIPDKFPEENPPIQDDEFTMLIEKQKSTHRTSIFGRKTTNSKKMVYMNELNHMKQELHQTIGELRKNIDVLENEQKRKIQQCIKSSKMLNGELSESSTKSQQEKYKKIQAQVEECRLTNSLANEKFKNCMEYLENSDSLINRTEKDEKKNDNFLRRLLFKTAKRQFKKSHLNEALETFCQLIMTTRGLLNGTEINLLFEISQKKIVYTYEFYHRITNAVKQIDDNCSKFVIDELWTSVIEDLRSECSDTYDIVMKVKADTNSPGNESCEIESLKYLMATSVCALWLQLTRGEHEEFEEIKDLFFESLENYIDTFACYNNDSNIGKNIHLLSILQQTIFDLIRHYPVLSNSKKAQKILKKLASDKNNNNETKVGNWTSHIVSSYSYLTNPYENF